MVSLNFEKNAVVEATKTIIRLILLAIPGIIIGYLTDLPETSTTAVMLLALRFIDNYIHESKKIKANGLVPF